MSDKRGVSGIIATVMMIAIVLAVTGAVLVSVNNLIGEQIKDSEACFGNFGKVTLEKGNTCYNSSSSELQFGINVGDISIDSLLVSISNESAAKSFQLSNTSINNVKMYGGVYGEIISVPERNAGFTYVADVNGLGIGDPNAVKIAPVIKKNQCEISDSLLTIGNC